MVQVTQVILPDRTRARMEAENQQQRVQKPHDIRSAIPLVDYTNPAKFPPYLFREYPKMPLLTGNKPIVIDESGGVLVFYDAADEVDFKSMNPELAEEIEANTPARAMADTMASQAAEIEDMRARLRAAGLDTGERKAKNPLTAVTRAAVAANEVKLTETASPAKEATPETGIRDTLPPNEPKKANPLKKKN